MEKQDILNLEKSPLNRRIKEIDKSLGAKNEKLEILMKKRIITI